MTFRRENSDVQPTFAATFYPGGQDAFTMPELISPAPQRCVCVTVCCACWFLVPVAEEGRFVQEPHLLPLEGFYG